MILSVLFQKGVVAVCECLYYFHLYVGQPFIPWQRTRHFAEFLLAASHTSLALALNEGTSRFKILRILGIDC